MRHDKIIERPDGTKVKIIVALHVSSYNHRWYSEVRTCPPGEVVFKLSSKPNDASPDEVVNAKMELIEQIKAETIVTEQ